MLIPLTPDRPQRNLSFFKRALIFVLRTFFKPIFSVFGKFLNFCFGWLNESVARKNEREFAAEIQTKFGFLFKEHAAIIVPNGSDVPSVPSFDGAYVTLATDSIRLRFTRGRGDFLLEVAPLSAPTEWESLELVVATIRYLPITVESRDFQLMRTVARYLPLLYRPLCDALRSDRAKETLDSAVRIYNERTEDYIGRLKQNGIVPIILKPK